MKIPNRIIEDGGIFEYLHKRNLTEQYQKAKNFVLIGIRNKTFFNEKKPKGSNIWYFRVNKQFRALGSFDKDGDLRIFKIDNHS